MQIAVISGMPCGRIHAQNQPPRFFEWYTNASDPSMIPFTNSISAVPIPAVIPSAKQRNATWMLWVKRKLENASATRL